MTRQVLKCVADSQLHADTVGTYPKYGSRL